MIRIGERINGMFPDVGKAIRQRDARVIHAWAERQAAAGAHYLDLSPGPAAAAVESMRWLVSTVQESCDLPLCLDAPGLETIAAGLSLCRRPAIINSCPAVRAQVEKAFPLARQSGAAVIGLTMDEQGIPRDAASRLALAMELVLAADEFGLPPQQLFIDGLLLPVNAAQDQAVEVLKTIAAVKSLSDPPPRTVLGLSNLSQGARDRSLIHRTYLVMAMAAGLDAAILDVTDPELTRSLATARVLLNQEIYAASYLEAGKLK